MTQPAFNGKLHFVARASGGLMTEVHDRVAWALLQLIRSGVNGCSVVTHPAPNWPEYVEAMRQQRFDIRIETMCTSDIFEESYPKYVLQSNVKLGGGSLGEWLIAEMNALEAPAMQPDAEPTLLKA
ncbi:hypothetical protein [Devosia sp. 1635]|uniref:winged helix domain-containing protein n=1 Tax=Devosia sp. 1635 TaxID=2726066 RepID=UPI00156794FA|nr:hypothetical protein [Devosia sp. 1635]